MIVSHKDVDRLDAATYQECHDPDDPTLVYLYMGGTGASLPHEVDLEGRQGAGYLCGSFLYPKDVAGDEITVGFMRGPYHIHVPAPLVHKAQEPGIPTVAVGNLLCCLRSSHSLLLYNEGLGSARSAYLSSARKLFDGYMWAYEQFFTAIDRAQTELKPTEQINLHLFEEVYFGLSMMRLCTENCEAVNQFLYPYSPSHALLRSLRLFVSVCRRAATTRCTNVRE